MGFRCYVIDVFVFLLVVTSLVGAFGGLAQVQFRPLLAYSSLGQTGWIGLVCLLRVELFILYMGLYTTILGGLLLVLNLVKTYRVTNGSGWEPNKGLIF